MAKALGQKLSPEAHGVQELVCCETCDEEVQACPTLAWGQSSFMRDEAHSCATDAAFCTWLGPLIPMQRVDISNHNVHDFLRQFVMM